ncbi:MAG TPA: cysteine--tRNA ligase [Anaerolineales bacterium]|nr:cysteine--tRNA ligase [Anaerolineales bacterium]
MSLKVYNTLTRQKEPFGPIEAGRVRMYVCGPTVYDKAHVGHAMSSIVFDIIRRYLEYRGYTVRHVMNYTDVDDKVIRRAEALGTEPIALAEGYIAEYDKHLRDLNVLPADAYPRVSQEIEHIIAMVKGLVECGFAYDIDGDVYFRVVRDEHYGKLSGRKVEDMLAGARLEVDERKEAPADFALWKSAKPGEPAWDSPWGKGRPGWHIECSAMSLHHLGEEIDIHGGGNDLIFPHHENEIAQTESLTGKPFARYWIHNGMAQLGGEAMSKSTGNVFTVEAFLSKYEANVLRMMILNSHYRSPLTFNDEVAQQAQRGLERMRGALRPPMSIADGPDGISAGLGDFSEEGSLEAVAVSARKNFESAMDDDFNTPSALASLFELVRVINTARDARVSASGLGPAQALLIELTGVLGVDLAGRPGQVQAAGPFIDLLALVRQELRSAQQWELADRIRDRLAELGVVLEDGKDGSLWRFRG